METQPRYFLKKEDRLKSRKIIDSLFNSGKQFSVFPFRVFWSEVTKENFLQAAFGVSSRNFKKATDRNRIKRMTKEAYRLQKNPVFNQLQEKNKQLSLFILYTGNEIPHYSVLSEKMTSIMKKLIKIVDEMAE